MSAVTKNLPTSQAPTIPLILKSANKEPFCEQITKIALTAIAALAGFVFLPMQAAIAWSASIAVVALCMFYTNNAPEPPPMARPTALPATPAPASTTPGVPHQPPSPTYVQRTSRIFSSSTSSSSSTNAQPSRQTINTPSYLPSTPSAFSFDSSSSSSHAAMPRSQSSSFTTTIVLPTTSSSSSSLGHANVVPTESRTPVQPLQQSSLSSPEQSYLANPPEINIGMTKFSGNDVIALQLRFRNLEQAAEFFNDYQDGGNFYSIFQKNNTVKLVPTTKETLRLLLEMLTVSFGKKVITEEFLLKSERVFQEFPDAARPMNPSDSKKDGTPQTLEAAQPNTGPQATAKPIFLEKLQRNPQGYNPINVQQLSSGQDHDKIDTLCLSFSQPTIATQFCNHILDVGLYVYVYDATFTRGPGKLPAPKANEVMITLMSDTNDTLEYILNPLSKIFGEQIRSSIS